MKFEVINERGATVMNTEYASCIPDKTTINILSRDGYKFKFNGKTINKKRAIEVWEEEVKRCQK